MKRLGFLSIAFAIGFVWSAIYSALPANAVTSCSISQPSQPLYSGTNYSYTISESGGQGNQQAGYQYDWQYGDGTADAGWQPPNPLGTVGTTWTISHTYASSGAYTLNAEVKDINANNQTSCSTLVDMH